MKNYKIEKFINSKGNEEIWIYKRYLFFFWSLIRKGEPIGNLGYRKPRKFSSIEDAEKWIKENIELKIKRKELDREVETKYIKL